MAQKQLASLNFNEKEKMTKKPTNTFTDPRDGQVYKTVKIGNQVWMAQNLNYDAPGSKCNCNDQKNAEKYGRLYDWETANKVAPPGWHLPSEDEWQELVDFAGGDEVAGNKFKAKIGWKKRGNGTDEYGFSALPGGYGKLPETFLDVGFVGNWWCATECGANDAWCWEMQFSVSEIAKINHYKTDLYSVRYLSLHSPFQMK